MRVGSRRETAVVTRTAALATAALLYGVVVVLQLCTPASVRIPSVPVVVPAVVALAFGPGVIVGSAVLAAGTRWVFFPIDHRLGAAIGTTAAICSIAALGCFVVRLRERKAVRLAKVNSVAEAAQRAILRPPPATVGQFHTAARYRAATEYARLHPGDTVLMYTDGLTKARDDSGAFYPLADRLTAYAHLDRPTTNPGDFLEWVEQDVRAYAGDTPHDDAALLALTWNRKP
ncbi:SpoIIE family protein phosphatase [Streptomyces sp. NPDC026665]|uniref:SpoIIE family protein phosphatase n=1 Tax=Streptomyces sp. NPDC026665 TaxID=3154798 RepID=UPI003406133B